MGLSLAVSSLLIIAKKWLKPSAMSFLLLTAISDSDFGYSIYSIYFLLFFPLIIIFFFVFLFVMANFLLCNTCLLCSMYNYLGRWRGCMQFGQSIVCLCLFRGHTCVCSSCWMPECQLVADLSSCFFLLYLSTIYG